MLRAAGPRTHVTSIVNGFTRPGAAAFGPLGNIGNAAQSAVEGEQGQAEGRPQRTELRQRRESDVPSGALLRPDLVQSATWIDHS